MYLPLASWSNSTPCGSCAFIGCGHALVDSPTNESSARPRSSTGRSLVTFGLFLSSLFFWVLFVAFFFLCLFIPSSFPCPHLPLLFLFFPFTSRSTFSSPSCSLPIPPPPSLLYLLILPSLSSLPPPSPEGPSRFGHGSPLIAADGPSPAAPLLLIALRMSSGKRHLGIGG